MTGWVVLGLTLAVGIVLGAVLRRRDGVLRAAGSRPLAGAGVQTGGVTRGMAGDAMEGGAVREGAATVVTAEDIGAELGERATLVQFSTAFCQPCRATRRVLADVAAMVPGVAHVEIDAESRLDLVRRFGVLRTPTVLVLDAAGNVTRRASGQPRKVDVIAALGAAIDP